MSECQKVHHKDHFVHRWLACHRLYFLLGNESVKTKGNTMIRKVMTITALAALFCGISGFAAEAENPPIRSKKITRPIEEQVPKYFIRSHLGISLQPLSPPPRRA